jgi:hypothetical protein
MKLPRRNPGISGRRYCTAPARCNPSPPAISRMKQATQIPIFDGFPQLVIRAARTPKVSPARIIRVLGLKNRRMKTSIHTAKSYVPAILDNKVRVTRTLNCLSSSGSLPHSAHPLSGRILRCNISTHSEPPETGVTATVTSDSLFLCTSLASQMLIS